ncbi:MAG: type II secretion system protein [Candidatus Hydrogenedentes bacterium]|jgi:type II secretory pathway pseudopilin PulG|nr:type II secretion system protein [Candidatus Hydrogenedentota bacterium]
MKRAGFTLVEVVIALMLVIFLSYFVFVAIQTTIGAVSLSKTQSELQSEARSLMISLCREVETAIQPQEAGDLLPPNVRGLEVLDNGRTIRFQIPLNEEFTRFSDPITITHENEDRAVAGGLGNAALDAGEDANGDGMLTRRLVRQQSGQNRVIGASNNVAQVQFELLENQDILRITLILTRFTATRPRQLVRCQIQEDVYLMN